MWHQWSDEGVVASQGWAGFPLISLVTAMKSKISTSRSRAILPRPLPMPLDQPGRLRIGHLMYLYGRSHQSIYTGLKKGLIPQPDGRDPRPYWLTSTIRPQFEKGGAV